MSITAESKKSSPRYLELDVLRGFAALSVLSFHYTTNYALRYFTSDNALLFLFPLGKFGVHLFFIISGFVILMTLEKTSHIFDFIVSRFSKLYPSYWCAILVTSIAIRHFLLLPSVGMEFPLRVVLINFSMVQSWLNVPNLDSVYWTLATELSFYFLMSLIFIFKGLRYVELFGVLWLGVMILSKYLGIHWPFWVFFKTAFYSLLQYGNLFVMGIFFYNLKTKGNKWYRHVGIALCILVHYLIWIDVEKAAILPLVFWTFLFYMFVMGRLSFVVRKPLVFFGTISYSLYLIHQNIGYIIIQWIYYFGANKWLMFFVPAVVSILIASLMTYLVEKPFMKIIKSLFLPRRG